MTPCFIGPPGPSVGRDREDSERKCLRRRWLRGMLRGLTAHVLHHAVAVLHHLHHGAHVVTGHAAAKQRGEAHSHEPAPVRCGSADQGDGRQDQPGSTAAEGKRAGSARPIRTIDHCGSIACGHWVLPSMRRIISTRSQRVAGLKRFIVLLTISSEQSLRRLPPLDSANGSFKFEPFAAMDAPGGRHWTPSRRTLGSATGPVAKWQLVEPRLDLPHCPVRHSRVAVGRERSSGIRPWTA
jgi:hypothetical protein